MSIYSGFATRNQQHFYDQILYNLVSTLLLRIAKFYRRQPIDDATFIKIIAEQQRSLKKLEKRKYMEPKFADLLTRFKREVNPEADIQRYEGAGNKEMRFKSKPGHQLNRTLSNLGRQFGEIRAKVDRIEKIDTLQMEDQELQPPLVRIEEHKRNVSKRKKKSKKTSIKSNLDIWEMRAEKPPELPSLHPMQPHKTIMSRTRFNNFSEKVKSKQMSEPQINNEDADSLHNILANTKYKSRPYFK